MSLGGAPLPSEVAGDYCILVARSSERPRAIPIPLKPEDPEPEVDLQAIVQTVYERGTFDGLIDYRAEPVPPLRPEDARWADALLRRKRLR